MRVIIAGGGTGGHIFPATAIGHALQRLSPGVDLLFVGANGKMEMEKVPKEGFRIVGLDIAGFNRSHLLKNLTLPFKLLKSRRQAQKILREFRPDAVVGVGGFASFPILYAAQSAGIPTLIQEQNSFAGKSNKILGKRAKAVCVAYEGMGRFFPEDRIFIFGNPVRDRIARSAVQREDGLKAFGLDPHRPCLLVVGGSLGALSINLSIEKSLSEIRKLGLQLIWQTGSSYIEQATKSTAGFPATVARAFIPNMEDAYAAADFVISRAGALAIAELCIAGKPAIFVPYPFAAEDHQTSNALALVNKNAALMVKDNEVGEELLKKLTMLVKDENMQEMMGENIRQMAKVDSDIRIAEKVLQIAKQSEAKMI